ncbi:hypothetical protein M413DRAFT_450097 [Hebeloma cylindrosporum]|uniref:FAD-binding domain-containing protein n=1 Tax=Hebeloma cylindrosporum TaxID=76867 RepID=A0A0C3BTM4_HEBCY|nr:hypothetical protein M413DRAFT_450097 [Hebeloma cylindrosporum h7]
MKILIVGGGIGGLSAYHALRKHLSALDISSITILESHESPVRTLGGGLGLAPNGQRAIASIAPDALDHILEHSFPGSQMTFRNSSGSLLGIFSSGRKERYGYEMVMLPRAVVHEALLSGIPEQDIRWGVKVKGVQESRNQVSVEYSDGSTEMADLVIGADGVRSAVKSSLFDGKFDAKYDGLTGVGGFIDLEELPNALQESFQTNGVTMTFGRSGFFGYSMCSPLPHSQPSTIHPFIQWWSIYECPVIPDSKNLDYDAVKAQLLSRHGSWKSPYDEDGTRIYQTIIQLGCRPPKDPESTTSRHDTSVMVLPRFITPRLPSWSASSGRIVLMGDAAHTMPPDVGQGVSCAAEDAVVYALLLKHYLASSPDQALVLTAKAYEDIRKPHIHHILDVAKRNGDAKKEKGWLGEVIRDFAMKIVCKLPESLNDAVFTYDPEAEVTAYLQPKPRSRLWPL